MVVDSHGPLPKTDEFPYMGSFIRSCALFWINTPKYHQFYVIAVSYSKTFPGYYFTKHKQNGSVG